MNDVSRIKSLGDFVNVLSELGKCDDKKSRFFRGHSYDCYQLIPSIYREPYLIKNEHKITQDAFTYCSEYFFPHETLFEKLVKLQHYGYKTRLLDITSNALVALYFSANNHDEKDGEVIVFDIPNDKIKYPDSDTVAILSALSLRDDNFDVGKMSVISKYNLEREKYLRLISEKQIINYLKDNNMAEINNFISLTQKIKRLPTNDRLGMFRLMTIKEFNKQEHIVTLLNDIRKDKPYFLPIIKNEDFNNVLCVRSKINNQRILRQHGSFLIFGMNNCKIKPAEMDKCWQRTSNKRLIVDGHSKQKILDELKYFGISHQALFPELDSQAQHIISYYKDN